MTPFTLNLTWSLCSIVCIFVSCSKKTPAAPTQVKVNVKDESGTNASGASVTFYASGYRKDTKISDADGNVLFDNITEITYYSSWIAEKGCRNNRNEDSAYSLVPHTVNMFNTIIYETGTLMIFNNSSELYNIASSVYTGNLPGGSTNHFFPNAGPFALHSEPASTPGSGKDTVLQITCGDTTSIILPY